MKTTPSLLIFATFATVISSLPAQARPAKCLLQVNGTTYIDGPCDFDPSRKGDGSFQITGAGGKHFAYVYVEGGGKASAHWNGVLGENRAHDPLGTLTRDGACWVNATAKLCAW
jgi:hypothetical protein